MGYEIEGAAVQKAVDVAKDIAITAGATELAGRSLKGIGKTIYGLSTRPTDIEKTAMQKYKARAPYSDKLF
jgi:hypothetical protein